MYLKVQNQKMKVQELNTFKDRFKSLKFSLTILNYGLWFPKKKLLNTTFFCQRVDACFTDEDFRILYLHESIKSEKRIFHFKSKHIFILPLGTCEKLKVGEKINLIQK